MKKLLFLFTLVAAFAFLSPPVHAQIVKKITVVKDSTVNTDTTYIPLALDNYVKSVEIHATKVSGTVAGTANLLGSVDGTNWDVVGTLTYANQAVNYKVFTLSALSYAYYKLQSIGSGTNKIKPIIAYIHRRTN